MSEREALPEDNPATDMYPGILFGVQSILGTIWWILSWFVYISFSSTFKLQAGGQDSVPLGWSWENLSSTTVGWSAASYFTTFWAYLLVSVIEFIAWFWWLSGEGSWLAWWSASVGWYGSVLVYPLPWLFALFQICMTYDMGGFGGNYTQEYGTNAIFLIIMGGLIWLFSGLTHVIYSPRLLAQVNPEINKPCMCDAVAPLNPLASRDAKDAYEAMAVALCYEKCPAEKPFCPLRKASTQSYEDYATACRDLQAKAASVFAGSQTEEEEI